MGQLLGLSIGGGQPTAPTYNINTQAFQNPVGDTSYAWNQGMQNMLPATTGAAPTAQAAQAKGAQLNTGQFQQAYGQEQGLAQQYAKMAAGQGPSLATVTANAQAQQGLNNTLAALGSQSGSSNPALAARAAVDAGSQASAQAAANAVQGRTQEELGALGAQGNLYNAMAGQASNIASENAQLAQNASQFNASNSQQAAIANLNAALQNKQINNQQYNQMMQLLQQQNLASFAAQQAGQQLGVQQQLGLGNINVPAQEWYEQQLGQGISSAMSNVGSMMSTMAGMSDKRVKKNISKAEKELDDFLSHIAKIMKEKK